MFHTGASATPQTPSEPICPKVLDLLRVALGSLDGCTIPPLPSVGRKTYEVFNEVLRRLHGKWKRGVGHVFRSDPRVMLEAVISFGRMPVKNPLAYFPTPTVLAEDMIDRTIDHASSLAPRSILEPSAGTGALLRAAFGRWQCRRAVAIEADPINLAQLQAAEWPRAEVLDTFDEAGIDWPDPNPEIIGADFLAHDFGAERFDLILMNPPFSVAGDKRAYEAHVRRAFDLLAPEFGRLAAIVPNNLRPEFKSWLEAIGAGVVKNHAGSFAESGTGVATSTIIAQQFPADYFTAECCGYESYPCMLVFLHISQSKDLTRDLRALALIPDGDPRIASFLRRAIVAANEAETGGVPVCDVLMRQLLAAWRGETEE